MVDKKNIKNIYGLSPMQEGMLMHTVYGDSPLAYFEQTRYRMTGDLDLAIFTETWQLIVQRHDIFRTLFVYENVPKLDWEHIHNKIVIYCKFWLFFG